MKNLRLLALAALLNFSAVTYAQYSNFVPANNPEIVYMGRINNSDPTTPKFVYPGVQISMRFTGTEIKMKCKPNSGFFMIKIDDNLPFKIEFGEGINEVGLAKGMPNTKHTVTATLCYEGYQRVPEFHGFVIDGQVENAPKLPTRKLEFIGDSQTCGYGIDDVSGTESKFYDKTENFYYTYAAETARQLNAQYVTVCRSGIGVYRNYNGPETGNPKEAMVDIYPLTNFGDPSQNWDYGSYVPDVVCINLGTNDTSVGTYKKELLEDGFRKLYKLVRARYPDTNIILIDGCMLNGKSLQDVQGAITKIVLEANESGDGKIFRLDFSPQDGSLGYATHSHPSVRQQKCMAEELVPFIRRITNWKD